MNKARQQQQQQTNKKGVNGVFSYVIDRLSSWIPCQVGSHCFWRINSVCVCFSLVCKSIWMPDERKYQKRYHKISSFSFLHSLCRRLTSFSISFLNNSLCWVYEHQFGDVCLFFGWFFFLFFFLYFFFRLFTVFCATFRQPCLPVSHQISGTFSIIHFCLYHE